MDGPGTKKSIRLVNLLPRSKWKQLDTSAAPGFPVGADISGQGVLEENSKSKKGKMPKSIMTSGFRLIQSPVFPQKLVSCRHIEALKPPRVQPYGIARRRTLGFQGADHVFKPSVEAARGKAQNDQMILIFETEPGSRASGEAGERQERWMMTPHHEVD
ncbi:7712_t:CDS:2 [Acaulospora morrowiae]|uniref:7712_t:CDS:1 n=1 Tax=Acaulospora morrowiae TaxID=94023 RepID=A0A9N9BS25_9GLOM|nr:7712_t:CDS:2 [Acaulospora morrowiae]